MEPLLQRRRNSQAGLSALLALLAAALFIAWLFIIFQATLPRTKDGEWPPEVKLPRTLADLKVLGQYLNDYTDQHYIRVSIAFISLYVFLQTFLIPGSIMLSILAGALFGTIIGVFYVAIATALGSTNCYCLSKYLAGHMIHSVLGERMDRWQYQLRRQKNHLFNYMIFLRVTPLLPNWFINLAAPHLGVPLGIFFCGTFFGVIPPSLLHVQAGKMLPQLQDLNHLLTFSNVITLILIGLIALLPILISRWMNPNDPTIESDEVVVATSSNIDEDEDCSHTHSLLHNSSSYPNAPLL
ncbi:snare associated Golgi protein-domain-containing protein [Syncephalis fuscata]|nr:snare associated Golgi protein-domain-containing protein [Syncephalis fuscata]